MDVKNVVNLCGMVKMSNPTLVLTDFPWSDCYGKRTNKDTRFGLGFSGHYKGMTNQEILDFKSEIDKVSGENSILLQWTTFPALDFSIEAMKHFGYTYKTEAFVWIKISKTGTPLVKPGYYFGSGPEVCLLGIKGGGKNMFKPAKQLLGATIMEPPREHSRKPEQSYERIEQAYPHLDKIEFFSRQTRENWVSFGDQVGKFR